jgi:serine/threonine protein kinase
MGRFPFCDDLSDDDLSDLDDAYHTTMGDLTRTPTHRDSFAVNKKRQSRRKSKGGLDAYVNQADSLGSMSIIELMHQIVREPAPRLDPHFAEEAHEFVDACLAKDPDERHGPKTLLVCQLFIASMLIDLFSSVRSTAGWTMREILHSISRHGQRHSNRRLGYFPPFPHSASV